MATLSSAAVRLRLVVVLALAFHVWGVLSIAIQPLWLKDQDISFRPPIARLFEGSVNNRSPAADFFAVYHAGVAARQGFDPYTGKEDPQVTPYNFSFRYLPIVAETLGRIVSTLDPRMAYFLWLFFCEVMLGLMCAWFWRHRLSALGGTLSIVSLLISTPYFLELQMGQFTFVTMALVLLGHESRRSWSYSLWLGAVLLKMYPIVAIGTWIRYRRWRLVTSIVAGAMILNAPLFILYPDWARSFFLKNFYYHGISDLPSNMGLSRVLQLLGLESRFRLAAFAAIFICTAVACFRGRFREQKHSVISWLFAFFLCYGPIWEHYYAGLVLLSLWGLNGIESIEVNHWLTKFAYGCVIALMLPTPFVFLGPVPSWGSLENFVFPLVKVIPFFLLWAYFTTLAFRVRVGG